MNVCRYCKREFGKREHLLRHQRSRKSSSAKRSLSPDPAISSGNYGCESREFLFPYAECVSCGLVDTGEKPFPCQECGRRYGRRDVLLRHVKYMHKESSLNISSELSESHPITTTTSTSEDSLQQDNSDPPVTQLSKSSRDAAPSATGRSISGNAPAAESPQQQDTFATVSMFLSQDETFDALPPAATSRSAAGLAETSSIQMQPLPEHGVSLPETRSAPVFGMENRNDMYPQTGRKRLMSKDADVSGEYGNPHQANHNDESSTGGMPSRAPGGAATGFPFMDIDMDIDIVSPSADNPHSQRPSIVGNILSQHDSQITLDMLDFLSQGSDADMLNLVNDFSLPFPLSPTTISFGSSSQDRMSTVPDKRFDLVSRLWPKRSDLGVCNPTTFDVWRDLVLPAQDPTGGDAAMLDPCFNVASRMQSIEWGIDQFRQQQIWQELDPVTFDERPQPQRHLPHSQRGSFATTTSSEGDESAALGTGFPSTRLLNLGLSIAFRQPNYLVSLINRPTFAARRTSNLFLFSLSLLGLILLDAEKIKRHIHTYLPIAIRKCCGRLAEPDLRPGASRQLISDISAATLLLGAISLCPDMWDQERFMAQMLYHHTLTVARLAGLFRPRSSATTTTELLRQVETESSIRGTPESQDLRWRTWAQLEELKRLISVLIVTDAWWSYRLGQTPLMPTSAVQYDPPCSNDLFRSPSSQSWSRLLEKGARIENQPVVVYLHTPWPSLADSRNLSPLGMIGLLSIVWVRILDNRWRMIPRPPIDVDSLQDFMIPFKVYPEDKSGGTFLESILQKIYSNFTEFLHHENPSCISMWHFLNIQLLVNVEVLEIAAGRNSVKEAHAALRVIASWSSTQAARRACLHAAGVYTAMSRRRTYDGLMLHSETSMFIAALVLGLYIFMIPQSEDIEGGTNPTDATMDPFEILDEVNWTALELKGFDSRHSGGNNEVLESQACSFISQGTRFNFMGTTCDGGYDAARMILLEFAHLMEDLGKGRSGFGRVLRAMSDSLIDMEIIA